MNEKVIKGVFNLLAAGILSFGIYKGCYQIALSNRYEISEEHYIILDKWDRVAYSVDNGKAIYNLYDFRMLEGLNTAE
jgi:hypothetical protein